MQETRKKMFSEITNQMLETYIKKNTDYGNSFEESLDEDGPIAFKVRAGDKWHRIKQLMKKDQEAQVKDEKLEDTIMDLANYCIMFLIWKEKEKYKNKFASNIDEVILEDEPYIPTWEEMEIDEFAKLERAMIGNWEEVEGCGVIKIDIVGECFVCAASIFSDDAFIRTADRLVCSGCMPTRP